MIRQRLSKTYPALSAFLKVFLCVVLVVSLCPPMVGAFAGADEAEVLEPQANDTQLDAAALEEGGLEVSADEGDAGEVDAGLQAGEAAGESVSLQATGSDSAGKGGSNSAGDGVDAPAPAADDEGTVDDSDAQVADPSVGTEPDKDAQPAADADSPQPSSSSASAEAETLTFEDKILVATVTAPAGVLPQGATLEVEEIHPVDVEKADAYAEALTGLADTLRAQDKVYGDVQVYDIRILDANGVEVEPAGKVSVSLQYKDALHLNAAKKDASNVDVAHMDDDGDVQIMDADIELAKANKVESASFETSSFSYYMVFSASGDVAGATEEVALTSDSWLKVYTPADGSWTSDPTHKYRKWGVGTDLDAIVSDADRSATAINEEGSHKNLRVVKIRLLNEDGSEYASGKTQYFWTWEQTLRIEDFNLPDLEVVKTVFKTAHSTDPASEQDSLIGSYFVRGYTGGGTSDDEANTLDIYVKPAAQDQPGAMRYIIRYVHADGSVSDGNVRYMTSGSQSFSLNKARDGEKYSGISIVAGHSAISVNHSLNSAGEENGSVEFAYTKGVNLAKAYVYYESKPTGNATNNANRYDKDGENYYYNAENSLYTDKSVEVDSDNNRECVVNLEAWYVNDVNASVGMIVDSSGSMAWTAGEPTPLLLDDIDGLTQDDLKDLKNNYYNYSSNYLTADRLASYKTRAGKTVTILDPFETDNSNLSYNGYKYFVKAKTVTTTNPINEYAALGYTDGNGTTSTGKTLTGIGGGYTQLGTSGAYTGRAMVTNWASDTDKNKNRGWYFVNSGTNEDNVSNFGGKVYEGLRNDPASGPCRFWVTESGGHYYLNCRFNVGNASTSSNNGLSPGTQNSLVYLKRDQMFTKAETLQDAISQFATILNAESPESEVSAVRYSHYRFGDNESKRDRLVLMNWTKNSEDITAVLDNNSTSAKGGEARGGVAGEYQYVITGGTYAKAGLESYRENLKGKAASGNDKYLIIFTDGLDQGTKDNGWETTQSYLENNNNFAKDKAGGYKIITVFMKSSGMTDKNKKDAEDRLIAWASKDENGDPLYYSASSDDAHAMVEQFRRIADYITTGLQNYSIRDYIDPRFDVLDSNGNVISVLSESSTPGGDAEFKSIQGRFEVVNGLVGFTTPDGKYAYLGYDKSKKMFYVLWKEQDIKTTYKGTETVSPWSGKVRLRAKEDFLGGNDILTNGNSADDNLVYKPVPETNADGSVKKDSSGNVIYKTDANGLQVVDTSDPEKKPYKSFPFASVNMGLLDVALGNYEDTIFLGETIKPGELLSVINKSVKATERNDAASQNHRVADTVYDAGKMTELGDTDQSSIWYVEYLERIGKKLHDNKDYYVTLFEHLLLQDKTQGGVTTKGVETLVRELDTGDYVFSDSGGVVTATGKPGTKAEGESVSIYKATADGDARIEVTVPYFYLESPTDPTTYAGPDTNKTDPRDDKVGSLTYTWKVMDFADNTASADTHNDEANKFVEFDTYIQQGMQMNLSKQVQYQFSISYEPLALSEDAKTDSNTYDKQGDGSERTRALVYGDSNANRETSLIRNTVGNEQHAVSGKQNTTEKMGWAVIHAVDGRIKVEKRMSKADYEQAKELGITANMTFTLTGEKVTSLQQDETFSAGSTSFSSSSEAELVNDDHYVLYSGWVSGLPMGKYTLSESVEGDLAQKALAADTDVEFMANDPARPYRDVAQDWAAKPDGSAVAIGITPNHTPVNYVDSNLNYTTGEDFANSVKTDLTGENKTDTPKNIDPALRASKAYLNAQIGHTYLLNEVVKAEFTIEKYLQEGTQDPTKATGRTIAFDLYKAKEVGGAWVKDGDAIDNQVTDSGTARAKFGNLLPGTYILEEGSGAPDGYSAGGPWVVQVKDGKASFTGENAPEYDGSAGVWKIVNKKAKISLRINKTATQTGSTDTVPLEGATFELRADDNGKSGSASIDWYSNQEATAKGTALTTAMGAGDLAGNATATAYGLKPGTTFWIVETSAPEGYALADPVKVVLDADGNATFHTKNQSTGGYEAGEPVALSSVTNATFETTIVDSALYALPAAGGLGVLEFLFLGAFIMTLVAGLARHTRRQPAGLRTAMRAARVRR